MTQPKKTKPPFQSGKRSSGSRVLLNDAVGQNVVRSTTGEFLARSGIGVVKSLRAAGFSAAEITKLVVSKRSLERRQQKNELLSALETDRALRVARIQDHANRVFGSEEKAHRWLRKPCRALEGAIPLELMVSETGAHIVDMELHAIDHGMFA